MNELDFATMGFELAFKLQEKNKIPKNQDILAKVIIKQCIRTKGMFMREYYRNVKNYDESVTFRKKIMEHCWELLLELKGAE